MASKNEDEAGFIDLLLYSLYGKDLSISAQLHPPYNWLDSPFKSGTQMCLIDEEHKKKSIQLCL